MAEQSRDIRGVMIQVTNGRVLLPNATVAEVITYSEPEKIPDAPDWLVGRIRWRGWRVPLFSMALLAGLARKEGQAGVRVTVLKALSGRPRMPFIALLAQGFPRLTTISPEILVPAAEEGMPNPPGVQAQLLVRDDQALIPDLADIEGRIAEAIGI